QEHHLKHPASADEVRKPGPQETACAVCDRDDSNQTCGRNSGSMSSFLRHGRSLGNDRDARAGVQKENGPQAVPLPRLESRAERVIRTLLLLADRRLPSGWAVVIGRISHEESRTRYRDEVSDAQNCEGFRNSEPRDQTLRNRCGDESTRAKSGDGESVEHVSIVMKSSD